MSAAGLAEEATRAFSYAEPSAPAWYACAECAAAGVKLWRPVHSDRSPRCAACVERKGGLSAGAIGEDGRVEEPHGAGSYRADQVAGLLPYVPSEGGESAWGYSSVPGVAVAWWRSLPTRPTDGSDAARADAFGRMAESLRGTAADLRGLEATSPGLAARLGFDSPADFDRRAAEAARFPLSSRPG